ncbi:transcriptional regulator, TetR family [Rhizobium sp. NFR07]|uniref:TetR/AcrR family transcriptional regulator n=1 Tax=Rhizobium sp. NFR07 TaxID=1566262 RepID=UPI0008E8D08B|nr:TetR/AcrR family transcriptional regulator [Rhizobium sp. NFR07]SFB61808.1 transcriptional regulator, TetR family [Rhizobium sp. NFR07]
MARPREFDRDAALERAMQVFWAKGFASTSTDDLREAMGIGRQSLYGAFGDKRTLYLEAFDAYLRRIGSAHLSRLSYGSPVEGIENLLAGLAPEDDRERELGCMGVGSVSEFGTTDPDLNLRRKVLGELLIRHVARRIVEGQERGELASKLDPDETAAFVLMAMTGLQIAARGGASAKELKSMARFVTCRLMP